ncbi:alpha/beta fold hydrolase [Piscinibacter koreensis]|uniref:Alpha/beta fold hydrolase n=1 Tax=Piscinibacter koreensis TaxID=2742824 RepID=A0A7Y6NN80_9BURK|nr:alpha/beta fold hydrolase [Schlegelella koreensis]NUZ06249.1 alpha/beta fold hydrolase [Schlegelella koreensis]
MQLTANGIRLEVEDHGSRNGEPLLLVMGLGMQLIAWPDGFVDALVARGFRVIRFDNRDIGLSQSFDHLGTPNLMREWFRMTLGLPMRSAYSLADMAGDAVGVLDGMGIARAHVCGASMGGMIAQHLAASHADRVKSATLVMTTSGARHLPGPSLAVSRALIARPRKPYRRAEIIEHYVQLYALIGSPGFPTADAELREQLGLAVDRSYHPQGSARQLMAIVADGDRTSLLGAIRAPTQVIHGAADPLVPLPAGRELARRIGGAELDVIDGMAHDLPEALWPRFVDGIAKAAGRA